jgi:arylsulfatase A-like enzyme
MNQKISLAICLFFSTVILATPKPNIIHIMVDDLGWQDIASHKTNGKAVYDTPHLDRLTKIGRRFTQAYSPAPTCAPSRVSFLRGQYPINTGTYHVQGGRLPRPWRTSSPLIPPYYNYGLANTEVTIADVLKEAGYITGHVGKWHAGGKSAGYPFPPDQGFDFGFTEKNGRHKYYNDVELWLSTPGHKNQFFGTWGKMKPSRISGFATNDSKDPYQLNDKDQPFDKPHDLAMGFINKHKDKPFFLNYCPYYVHGPIQTRNKNLFLKYLDKMGYQFPSDEGPLDKGIPGHTNPYYASMVETVDYMIGDVLSYLEKTDDPRNPSHKLIDNTYLIVDSDNGGVLPYTDNSPLKGGKQRSHEGGIRIPFLIIGPKIPAGTSSDLPINLVDLFPTFMRMAGLQANAGLKLDGADILNQFHGSEQDAILSNGEKRESMVWYFPMDSHSSAAMRKGPWKLIRDYGVSGGGPSKAETQLFRLYNEDGSVNDLGEKHNLAKENPEIFALLNQELDSYLATNKARMPYRNASTKNMNDKEAQSIPKVLSLSSNKDQLSLSYETGKNKIVEAELYYTLNPKQFDSTRGHREEWFIAPAKILDGKISALAPPGATHMAFILRDSQNFMISSEKLPTYGQKDVGHEDSEILAHAFAWKPGLYAMIRYAQAAQKLSKKGTALEGEIKQALVTYNNPHAKPDDYAKTIFELRKAIRKVDDTPQSKSLIINRFPTDPLF